MARKRPPPARTNQPVFEPIGSAGRDIAEQLAEITPQAERELGLTPGFLRHAELSHALGLEDKETEAALAEMEARGGSTKGVAGKRQKDEGKERKSIAIRNWLADQGLMSRNAPLEDLGLPISGGGTGTAQEQIGKFLEGVTQKQMGGRLTPEMMKTPIGRRVGALLVAANVMDELTHHLGRADKTEEGLPPGVGWYSRDITRFNKLLHDTMKSRPGLENNGHHRIGLEGDPRQVLFNLVMGITSNGTAPVDNMRAAMQLYMGAAHRHENTPGTGDKKMDSPFAHLVPDEGMIQQWRAEEQRRYNAGEALKKGGGKPIPPEKLKEFPEPNTFWQQPLKQQQASRFENSMMPSLRVIQALVRDLGEEGAAHFVLGWHDPKHLQEHTKALDLPELQMDEKGQVHGGSFVGPKVGSFFGNLQRLLHLLTVDRWQTKSTGRQTGQMIETTGTNRGKAKSGPHPGERGMALDAYKMVQKVFGMLPALIQAPHWYFEPALQSALGARAGGTNYEAGVKKGALETLNQYLEPHEQLTPEELDTLHQSTREHTEAEPGQGLHIGETHGMSLAEAGARHVLSRKRRESPTFLARFCRGLRHIALAMWVHARETSREHTGIPR